MRSTGLLTLALALAGFGCSFVVGADPEGVGIGASCEVDGDCHASKCIEKVCSASCGGDADCPAPSSCIAGACQVPLKVGAVYVGFVDNGDGEGPTAEGWTVTHDQGIRAAVEELGYVDFAPPAQAVIPGQAAGVVEKLIEDGSKVIIANSFSHRAEMLELAERHPDVNFLTCAANVTQGENFGSYFGRIEQAWFVAGIMAAAQIGAEPEKRLGMIGSFITPEVVRHINAFTLGARSVDPAFVVEVRWIGFWYDYNTTRTFEYGGEDVYREELLAAQLIESGCRVIAHQADNGRSVRYIDAHAPNVWSLANDNRDGCLAPGGGEFKSCIGSVYWNWGPLYTRILEELQHGVWRPAIVNENITSDQSSIASVGFVGGNAKNFDGLEVQQWLQGVSGDAGVSRAFQGPYATTGQRPAVAANVRPNDEELYSMCWFVEGVVEKVDPEDPSSPDKPALVPDGDHEAPAGTMVPPGAPPGVGQNCRENQ